MKLYRVILPVPDIEQAFKFYEEALVNKGQRVSPGRHYFDLEGMILALYDPQADGDEVQSWQFHENQYLYFAVRNLEEVHARLKKTACKQLDQKIGTMPWGERLFYAQDPFGTPICFVDEQTVFLG
ncbi:hypothetical protein GCM10028791_18790 [Echinicola sediminis]